MPVSGRFSENPCGGASAGPHGAEASAMLYTLVETAKAAGLEPRANLHYLFDALPGGG